MSRVTIVLIAAVLAAVILASRTSAQLKFNVARMVDLPIGCELWLTGTPDTDINDDDGVFPWKYHDIIPRDDLNQYHATLLRWNKHDSAQHYLDKSLGKLRTKIGNCIKTAMDVCVTHEAQQCYSHIYIAFGTVEFNTVVTRALIKELVTAGYTLTPIEHTATDATGFSIQIYSQ